MGEQRPQVADKELAALDRLVGTWRRGDAEGTIRYRWLEEGHFLIQDLDLEQGGEKGSPACLRASFSADGTTFSGGWVWPGGGYEVTGTRIATTEAPAVEDDR
jgi:hypothetical protein